MADPARAARAARRAPGRSPARLLALACAAVLLATGCASLPTSSPVQQGAAAPRLEPPRYQVRPVGPIPGSPPAALVRGFLRAAVGVEDDVATAREYLLDSRGGTWRPTARTVVHTDAEPQLVVRQAGRELDAGDPGDPAAGPVTVTVTAPAVGTVDAHGAWAGAPPGAVERVELVLVRQGQQWRIAELPDQLLLPESEFTLTHRPHPLYFPDRARARLVGEVRWLPERAATATTLVTELLRGPSPWLAPAVAGSLPPGTALADRSVPVAAGTARVDLTEEVLELGRAGRADLVAALEETLGTLPTVTSVRVTVEGGVLEVPVGAALRGEAPVDPAPVLLRDGAPVRLRGGQLVDVRDLPVPDPGAGDPLLSDPAVAGDTYAVLAGGRTRLLRVRQGASGVGDPVLTGAELTAPSFDPQGWLWSTEAASAGTVTAVGPDGRVATLEAGWLAGRRIASLRASREGARLVVASTGADGSARVDLVGVRRDGEGAPVELSADPAPPTPWLASVREAVWVDAGTVAVLGTAAPGAAVSGAPTDGTPGVFTLTGGRATALGGPGGGADPVDLACGTGERTLLLGGADGTVWQRAGTAWVPVPGAAGAVDPAHAG